MMRDSVVNGREGTKKTGQERKHPLTCMST